MLSDLNSVQSKNPTQKAWFDLPFCVCAIVFISPDKIQRQQRPPDSLTILAGYSDTVNKAGKRLKTGEP